MKKRNGLLLVVVLMVGLLLSTAELKAGWGDWLDVDLCYQEHSQWCWNGCDQCILYWYGYYYSQCTMANYAWWSSECCYGYDFYWNHYCNSPNWMWGYDGSMQDCIYYFGGIWTYGNSYYLYFSECQTEVNNSRPFVIGFSWTGGGGHVMVGYGYWTYNDGSQYLGYMDPWDGYTWSEYWWTVSAYDHYWDSTLRIY